MPTNALADLLTDWLTTGYPYIHRHSDDYWPLLQAWRTSTKHTAVSQIPLVLECKPSFTCFYSSVQVDTSLFHPLCAAHRSRWRPNLWFRIWVMVDSLMVFFPCMHISTFLHSNDKWQIGWQINHFACRKHMSPRMSVSWCTDILSISIRLSLYYSVFADSVWVVKSKIPIL